MIEIARAREEHKPALARLFDEYRRFFTGREDMEVSCAFIDARLQHDDSVIFVALLGGRACGFIQLYPLWSSWYCKRIWFLSDLYVDEASRGRGAATRLVERVKAHAAQSQAASVMVELPQAEPHLYAFYERLGFTRDPIFDLARYSLV
jgi:GNAT superfamily N-acetyltransferase